MVVENESTVASFDGNTAARVARQTVDGTLYSVIEFDSEQFNPLYVADETVDMYRNPEHMENHFNRIHTHVHMDFMEINAMTDSLFSAAEEVQYITTSMDLLKLLRVYQDKQGLFLALEPDEPVQPLVEQLQRVMQNSSDKP